ncbi:unnamed protein product [Caenorhabditis bovis]|uniref:Reverse transcriptase domain-containing protein n=1 Tax=Caenorhabditis bovis TaxID=2654633 RepID=A0A8S1EHU7_9PELO|nr:unnamed protein product [Caenorhabditis bovis]
MSNRTTAIVTVYKTQVTRRVAAATKHGAAAAAYLRGLERTEPSMEELLAARPIWTALLKALQGLEGVGALETECLRKLSALKVSESALSAAQRAMEEHKRTRDYMCVLLATIREVNEFEEYMAKLWEAFPEEPKVEENEVKEEELAVHDLVDQVASQVEAELEQRIAPEFKSTELGRGEDEILENSEGRYGSCLDAGHAVDVGLPRQGAAAEEVERREARPALRGLEEEIETASPVERSPFGSGSATSPARDRGTRGVATFRLPTIEIPSFDGERGDFDTFYEIFMFAVGNNEELDTSTKLILLLSKLKGRAARVIEGLPRTASSYEEAWRLLKRRYQVDQEREQEWIHEFECLRLPRNANPLEMQDLLDRCEGVIRRLARFNLGRAPMMASRLLEKFPESVQEKIDRQMARYHVSFDIWTMIEELQQTLRTEVLLYRRHLDRQRSSQKGEFPREYTWEPEDARIHTALAAEHRPYQMTRSSNWRGLEGKTTHGRGNREMGNGVKRNGGQEQNAFRCPFDGGDHRALECWLELSQKRAAARSGRLCWNCLSPNHFASQCHAEPFKVSGVGGTSQMLDTAVYEIPLAAGEFLLEVEATAIPRICHEVDRQFLRRAEEGEEGTIESERVEIGLLIGMDHWVKVMKEAKLSGLSNGQVLLETPLGSCVCGRPTVAEPMSVNVGVLSDDEKVAQMWNLDYLGIQMPASAKGASESEQVVREYLEKVEVEDGEVHVAIPFNGKEKRLSSNYPVAHRRLVSQFHSLRKEPNALEEYDKTIQTQLASGIIEACDELDGEGAARGPCYYIPHSRVLKPDSNTTKVRVVLDCSSHMRGELSLNDCVHNGPSVLRSLMGILLRARVPKILIAADIEKAFHQIRIKEADRDAVRFLWWKDLKEGPVPGNVQTFRFTRLPFGLGPSPFLLSVSILMHLRLNPHKLNKEVEENIYVDNVQLGAESDEEAVQKCREVKQIFAGMRMNLREFVTNSAAVSQQIPEEDRQPKAVVSLLGMVWDTEKDNLSIKFPERPKGARARPTKRNILAHQASVFDPLGMVAPLATKLKQFFQYVWGQDVEWDQELSDSVRKMWETVESSLEPRRYEIPRRLTHGAVVAWDLVIFSDASKYHYAMAAYVRGKLEDDTFTTQLVMAKSRVNPKEHLSIPRLELLGVLIASNSALFLVDEMQIAFKSVVLFCDSKIALYWIKGSNRLKTFVSNQVKRIRSNLEACQRKAATELYYVRSQENPADLASRGASLGEIADSRLWREGPAFLRNERATWPDTGLDFSSISKAEEPEVLAECVGEKTSPKRKKSDPGAEVAALVVATVETERDVNGFCEFVPYHRARSLSKLVGIMAAVTYFLSKVSGGRVKWKGPLMPQVSGARRWSALRYERIEKWLIVRHYEEMGMTDELRVDYNLNPHVDEDGGRDGLHRKCCEHVWCVNEKTVVRFGTPKCRLCPGVV